MKNELFNLWLRLERTRSDERASVTLLTGMMVFLATIFALITIDTSAAIHNRIVTQNAVDSAADAAALWQARGCNMLQELNNFHYDADKILAIAEDAAASACVVSGFLLAAEAVADAFFGLGEATIREARMGTCAVCATLPLIDVAQQQLYTNLMRFELGLAIAMPPVAFGYANACAKGSGADKLGEALPDAANGLLAGLGISIPGADSVASSVSSLLGAVDVYALPLAPSSFLFGKPGNWPNDQTPNGLYVFKRNNNGWPLDQSSAWGDIGDPVGEVACEDVPTPYTEAKDLANSLGWDGNWGWNDQYYGGHPGFSTWIAGKKHRDEVFGLGNLRWLNGGDTPPAELNYMFNQSNLPMFNDTVTTSSGSPLQIPGFVALASSQVEGTPVIEYAPDNIDARGKLIKVYLPTQEGGVLKAGENLPFPFTIYH